MIVAVAVVYALSKFLRMRGHTVPILIAFTMRIYLASIGTVGGVLLELSDLFDDNLTVPIGAGICIILARLVS